MPSSKQSLSPLVLIAIMIAGLFVGYIYYIQLGDSSLIVISEPPISAQDTLSKFKNIAINFSLFDDTKFKSLKVIGESPVNPGTPGKKDLFAPF